MASSNDFLTEIRNINILNRSFINKKAPVVPKLNDPTDLISEVYRVLGKYSELKTIIAKILFSELVIIEKKIKQNLLNNLNSFVNCSYNAIIPESLISDGIKIELKNLDYKKLLKNNPSSDIGKLTYYDINAGLNSEDMNTFLWNVINTNPTSQNWKNIVSISFTPVDIVNNKTNIFNIKINSKYSGKHLKEFNTDFINNLDIFDEKTLLTNLFDSSFGIINKNKKSTNEIMVENETDNMVETIINSDDDFEDNDGDLYGFSSDKYNEQIKQTIQQKFNLLNLNGDKQAINTSFEDTSAYLIKTENSNSVKEKISLFNNYVDNIQPANFENEDTNKSTKVKENIIKSILKKLLLVISNIMVSPKILIILYLNNYMTNGEDEFNKNANIKDLIKSLKTTIYSTIKGISNIIIDYFTKNLTKLIMDTVVTPTIKRKVKEKVNMKLAQIKSLVS